MTYSIHGLHHVTLRVHDLARSQHFYERVLGLTLDQDFEDKLRFRLGPGTRLVLKPPLPGTPQDDRFSERRIGLDHLSLEVEPEDLTRLLAAFWEAGIATEGINRDPTGPRVLSFRDPDNIAWEFFAESAAPRV